MAEAAFTTHTLPGGTRRLIAAFSGTEALAASNSVAIAHQVLSADQSIAFIAPPDQAFAPDATPELSATATSGPALAFASRTGRVCSVSGTTVTLLRAGSCTIRTSQAGRASRNAAPHVDRSFRAAPGATAQGVTVQGVTVHCAPSELGGLPSGVSPVWADGSEHLALRGLMAVGGDVCDGAGRSSWTCFAFYPTRPLIRIVRRQVTPQPAPELEAAQELLLRLRVQNFAVIQGCTVTMAAILRRGG